MKTIIISLFMAITAIAAHAQQKSFYDFTVKTIDGEDLSLSTFKGKTLLLFINGLPKKVKTAWKTQKNITSPEIISFGAYYIFHFRNPEKKLSIQRTR